MIHWFKTKGPALAMLSLVFIFTETGFAAGTSGGQFLKLGAGARAAAMGDAFTSVANDVTGAYYNPAGLTQLETPEVAFMQNAYVQDTQYQYVGFAMPLKRGALSFSFYRLDFGTIDRYTAADVKDGSFDAGSMAGAFTYAKKLSENLSLGVTAKTIQESIESESASSFAGDIGLHTTIGLYKVGASIQNIGSAMKFVNESYALPQTLRLGASTLFLDDRLLIAADISKPNDNDLSTHLGAEYKPIKMLALRSGYRVSPDQSDLAGLTGLSAGLGITFNRLNFDYSVTPFGELGISHKISLLMRFKAS